MENVALPVLEDTLFPSPRALLAGLAFTGLDDLRVRVLPPGIDWVAITIDRQDDFTGWDDPFELDAYLAAHGTDGEAAVEQLEVVARHSGVLVRAWVAFPNSLGEVRRMVTALGEATRSVPLSKPGESWITGLDDGDAETFERLESLLEAGLEDSSHGPVSVESDKDAPLGVPGLRLGVGGWPGGVLISVAFPINLVHLYAWMSQLSPIFEYPQPLIFPWLRVVHVFPFLEQRAFQDAVFLVGDGTVERLGAERVAERWVELRLTECMANLGARGLTAIDFEESWARRDLTELILDTLSTTQKREHEARTLVMSYQRRLLNEAASKVPTNPRKPVGVAPEQQEVAAQSQSSTSHQQLSASQAPPIRVAAGAVAAMLLLGTALVLPYDYYTVLRLVVCTFACVLLWVLGNPLVQPAEGQFWSLVAVGGLAATALLFNPIVPIALERETWAPIDVAAAIGFLTVSFLLTRPDGSIGRVTPND